MYDPMSRKSEEAGMRDMRHSLLADARGSVLEIGGGTGANLTHYDGGVESLVLTEPEPAMLRRLQKKAREQTPLAKVLRAPAEDLPFETASFDTVVSTLVLCTVGDPEQALAEIRRVLRPGGRLLFLEHVEAEGRGRRGLQRRSSRAWAAFADGCRCDRPTLATIESQMQVESLSRGSWRAMPAIVKPLVWGSAVTA